MTYLFIIIIASLISFIVFEKNFKQLLFSKKNIFSLIIFYSITFAGVGLVYYKVGYPYNKQDQLQQKL